MFAKAVTATARFISPTRLLSYSLHVQRKTQTHCVCDMGIGNPVRGSVYTVRSEVELPLKFKLRPNSDARRRF